MNKADFVTRLMEVVGSPTKAEASKYADAVIEIIRDTLIKGENITFTGLGTLRVADRAERTGRNPKTGETIKIPAKTTVRFVLGKEMKDRLKK